MTVTQSVDSTDPGRTIRNERLRASQWRYGLPTILIPHLGLVIALRQVLSARVGGLEIGLLAGMYVLTMLGITVGYHRYLTHRSFRTHAAVRAFLAILGSMTAQGPVINWVSNHRRHHRSSDRIGDPHSPYLTDKGAPLHGLRGFWHAHVGWLFDGEITNALAFSKDLLRDPVITLVNKTYLVWVALGLAIPAVLGGVLGWSWAGAAQGLLWGGLVRIALVQNATWSIGSLAHIFGERPFETGEQSRNSLILAIPILGDGWHNNHHAFPTAAISGFGWRQPDPSGWVIAALEKLGLAWDVNGVPSALRMNTKKSLAA